MMDMGMGMRWDAMRWDAMGCDGMMGNGMAWHDVDIEMGFISLPLHPLKT